MTQWVHDAPSRHGVSVRRVEPEILEIFMHDDAGANGMTAPWVAALLDAMAQASADGAAKVVLLTGLAEVFCSGATRDTLRDLVAGRLPPTELTLGRRLMAMPVPVIAAAEGHAIGGGLALLVSCDLAVIAAESRYGANFMSLGITPGMGMTRLLETVMGRPLAHELLYTGDLRRGATLVGAGNFNAVLPRSQVRAHALQLARALAEKPRHSLVLLKRALTAPRLAAFDEAAPSEARMHAETLPFLDINSWGQL